MIGQERPAASRRVIQLARFVAVVDHQQVAARQQSDRPGDPAGRREVEIRLLPVLEHHAGLGHEATDRLARRGRHDLDQASVAVVDVDLARAFRRADEAMHREGVEHLVGEDHALEPLASLDRVLRHPLHRQERPPLQPRALARLQDRARLDQKVAQGPREAAPRAARRLQEVGGEAPLAGAELDEEETLRPPGAVPHLLGLARHQDAEGLVNAAAGQVVPPAPPAQAPRIVAVAGMVEAELHEARERDRAAARDLRLDERAQRAGLRVRRAHRAAPDVAGSATVARLRSRRAPSSTSRCTFMIPSMRASGRGGQPGM